MRLHCRAWRESDEARAEGEVTHVETTVSRDPCVSLVVNEHGTNAGRCVRVLEEVLLKSCIPAIFANFEEVTSRLACDAVIGSLY